MPDKFCLLVCGAMAYPALPPPSHVNATGAHVMTTQLDRDSLGSLTPSLTVGLTWASSLADRLRVAETLWSTRVGFKRDSGKPPRHGSDLGLLL